MSKVPNWLNDTVKVLGHQMGLKNFTLNEVGTAELHFENDLTLALEYALESLVISVRLPLPASGNGLRKLLMQAHPAADNVTIRAFYLPRAEEGGCAMVLPENQVNVSNMEAAIRKLWNHALYLKRIQ